MYNKITYKTLIQIVLNTILWLHILCEEYFKDKNKCKKS